MRLVKNGRRVRFRDLRPGYFECGGDLALMSEYGHAAYNEGGERWWGPPEILTTEGLVDHAKRDDLLVQPMVVVRRQKARK